MTRKHPNHVQPARERNRVARPPRATVRHGRNLLRALGRRTNHPDFVAWLAKNGVRTEQLG
jgi:hypothetical protein